MDVTAATGGPSQLSVVALLYNADPVVKGVMGLLVGVSAVCWGIAIEKLFRLIAFSRQVKRVGSVSEKTLSTPSRLPLGWLHARLSAIVAMEPKDASESHAAMFARLEQSLNAEIGFQVRRLQGGLPFLATVGATAPFIGLFGTVWGIMRSFTGIAAAKDTSLAVVAPGIAEALFATALGLVAAIPAVIFYNQINASLTRIGERLSRAATALAKRSAYGTAKPEILVPGAAHPVFHESGLIINGGLDAR